MSQPIKIKKVDSNFEREPLVRPFGFKGIYQREIWGSAALLTSRNCRHVGLMTQGPAWSDIEVFSAHTEVGGNMLLYLLLEYALQLVKAKSFVTPLDLQDQILARVYEHGKRITNNKKLRMTFALSSLVALDNAAWMLYAEENGFTTFDEMIPAEFRKALTCRHEKAAHVPLMSYAVPMEEIEKTATQGDFVMKIKIGRPGTQEEMLAGDKKRIEDIHKRIGHSKTPYTADGKIPYYFDANGRYEKKDTLKKLIDHAARIGMLDQIMIIEEPFPEEADIDVGDLGVRIAADESAHTAEDVKRRIEMGYGAIALKAAAKTLSMTFRMAKAAFEHKIPCFLADLTCTPILVDWNKNVAARLQPMPGLKNIGLLESNGSQNYKRWQELVSYHPYPKGSWIHPEKGCYRLNADFYKKAGGILTSSQHYLELFRNN